MKPSTIRDELPPVPEQYSLRKIMLIWLLSALPMAILAFGMTPIAVRATGLPAAIMYWLAIIAGLIWQFILSLLVLKQEGQTLRWTTLRKRLWFQAPRNPKTGKPNKRLLLWVLPFIAVNAILSLGIGFPDIDQITAPLFRNLPQYDLAQLATPAYKGAWWVLGLYVITMAFNYFLGEELLYRGVLLPRMKGAFGKYDWFVNGVLFGFYHLHKPHIILSTALLYGFVFAFPSRRFQSSWMAVIIHGMEGLLGLGMVLSVILG